MGCCIASCRNGPHIDHGRLLSKDDCKQNNFQQRYTLGKKLGCGTYSEVYEATRIGTNNRYAVKITKVDNGNKRVITFVERELESLKSLKHPNIVQLFEAFHVKESQSESSHTVYSVVELVAGGELSRRLQKVTWFYEREAREIVTNLMSAIKYLHDKNIAHRDLKMENILLPNDGDLNVKIVDFAFAKVTKGADMLTPCGSPLSVAPEILLKTPSGVQRYGKAVDMWSLGIITYWILVGYPPFHDENLTELFKKIVSGRFQFHERHWARVSKEAKQFVSGLLEIDSDKRLTVDQALAHPWVRDFPTVCKTHARRRFRVAVKAIIVFNTFLARRRFSTGCNSKYYPTAYFMLDWFSKISSMGNSKEGLIQARDHQAERQVELFYLCREYDDGWSALGHVENI